MVIKYSRLLSNINGFGREKHLYSMTKQLYDKMVVRHKQYLDLLGIQKDYDKNTMLFL